MRNILICLTIFILLFTSCEEVINMDLNQASPRIVIEGNITDKLLPKTIKISESGNYFESKALLKQIQGATVSVTDNLNNTYVYTEQMPGIYQSGSYIGYYGNSYRLTINLNNKIFEAESTMPNAAKIDSFTVIENQQIQGNPFSKQNRKDKPKNYFIKCYFKDSAQTTDFYRLETKLINRDTLVTERYYIVDDKYFNGTTMEINTSRTIYIKTDSVKLTLHRLNKPTYNYYRNMNNIIGNRGPNGNALFDNPPSNLSGNALGFFSASAVNSVVVVVK